MSSPEQTNGASTNPLLYVISADVERLFKFWEEKTSGIVVPSATYFNDYCDTIRTNVADATGAPVEVVGADELRDGMTERARQCDVPCISMDRAYIHAGDENIVGFFDTTRAMRPDPETGMNQRRGVEGDRDRQKLPEYRVVVDAGGECIHRDIAERMVEEMADQIGKQHQPASQPNLPDADAADEARQTFLRKPGHVNRLSDHGE